MTRALLLAALGTCLWAGGTATWESNTYSDFVRGKFNGVSLTKDGRLVLAPKPEVLFTSTEGAVWSVVLAKDGTLYAGTGHKGKVFSIDKAGKMTLLWTAQQPEVFALALDPQGVLYAATSPDGRIFKLEGSKATEFANPQAKYVWALAFGPDGALYAGTGDQGRVLRFAKDGKSEVWFETGQSHVTGLHVDAQGRVLAGTEPNGILYRVQAKGKAFVLYDSSLPEIRSIVPGDDGSIYVSALGGAVARQNAQAALNAAATAAPTPTISTSITVTSDSTQAGIDLKPKPDQAKTPTPMAPGESVPGAQQVVDMSGMEKSAIYRIYPDNSVETLWSSKEENVYDIARRGKDILFSTDLRGRIYRLTDDLRAAMLVETREGETTRLMETPGGLLAGTSNLAKLFRMDSKQVSSGTYESPVHDANTVARWGHLAWRGDVLKTAKLTFRTRSGNSARPDSTWSDWSEPLTGDGSVQIPSPGARFIQWQLEMSGGGEDELALDSVAVNYLPQNNRPIVRGITVTPQWTAVSQKAGAAATAPQPASYSITVTDTGEAGTSTSSGTPTTTVARSGTPQLMIAWQADDPDNDRLVYALWFRGDDEKQWKLVKNQLTENTHMLDSETLADGRYQFRVVASDRLSNPTGTAREAELVSAPVLVDNTPPQITIGPVTRKAGMAEIPVAASDSASPLRRAEYNFDAGPWMLLEPTDGILDERKEDFLVRLPELTPGEHVIVVRVFDSSSNPGLAKAVLK